MENIEYNNIKKKEILIKQMLCETEMSMLSTTENLTKQTESIDRIGEKINELDSTIDNANFIVRGMYGLLSFPKKMLQTIKYNKSKDITFDTKTEKTSDEIMESLRKIKNQSTIQKELIDNNNKSLDQIISKTIITSENMKRLNKNITKL